MVVLIRIFLVRTLYVMPHFLISLPELDAEKEQR